MEIQAWLQEWNSYPKVMALSAKLKWYRLAVMIMEMWYQPRIPMVDDGEAYLNPSNRQPPLSQPPLEMLYWNLNSGFGPQG